MLQLLKTLISSAQSSLPAYQEISLDGTTRYSTGPQSSAASARSQKARQVLINICTYSLPPLFLLWLFASPKGSTPDFIHGEPYACYGNGEMVLATTLEGYAKQLNHSTSPRNRVEIGLDRHLSYDQCDTFFPDQYQWVLLCNQPCPMKLSRLMRYALQGAAKSCCVLALERRYFKGGPRTSTERLPRDRRDPRQQS